MIDPSLRVRVEIGGIEYVWTLNQARGVIGDIREAMDALRVKCPTCRCRIFPGATCSCCADCGDEDVAPAERETRPELTEDHEG